MNKTILLADDSVTIRKVVELTFMDESFELISVGTGKEALESFDDNVDLVIADVHMPGADGYEVCREIKSESPRTPVLLLVGTFESFDADKATKAGADGHLKKPFDSQDLLANVRGLLERAEAAEPERDEGPSQAAAEDAEATPEESVFAAAAAPPASTDDDERAVSERSAEPDRAASGAAETTASAASGERGNGDSDPRMSEEAVDRIARRVVELLSEEAIRDVAWEVIPDLAEVVIKERLNELESQAE